MRQLCIWLFIWVLITPLTGQKGKADFILDEAEKIAVPEVPIRTLGFSKVAVEVPYGKSELKDPSILNGFEELTVESVKLIYTDFPKNNNQQRKLNRDRILQLGEYIPEVLDLVPHNWQLVKQTDCQTPDRARKLFHGFILTVRPTYDPPDFTDEAELAELVKEDSTISTVISRNDNWKKMLVITDLTSSMAPYTAQLLVWFKLTERKNKVEHFIFFNDGDDIPDSDKELGKTGGIYHGKASSFEEIAKLANTVVEKGYGGDIPENNVEALLYGLRVCPECHEIVMIADNLATPRDMPLIEKVHRPVRIILCGTEPGINTAYLELAYKTGGSVHTIENDITSLMELNDGEEIQIGKEVFRINDGKFELIRRI